MSERKSVVMYRTMKIPIEQDERLDEIAGVWHKMLNFCLHSTVQKSSYSMSKIQKEVYQELRQKFLVYQSQHVYTALKTACEMVKGTFSLLEGGYTRMRFPKVRSDFVILSLNTVTVYNNSISIAYKPFKRIELKLYPSKEQQRRLMSARFKGFKLVKRGDKWWFYISEIKEVQLPRWEWCETFIGVDVGMNYLVVATAVGRNGELHKPLFVSGKQWRHLQFKRRAKMAKLQSKAMKGSSSFKSKSMEKKASYFWNRTNEILHIASKRVVKYAKQFPKPIIVLEELGNMKNNSQSRKWNYLLGMWARRRLQNYIKYKAEWEGIPVVEVYPQHTSQICYRCGKRGVRNGKDFYCPYCDKHVNADFNASINVANRFRHQLVKVGIDRGHAPFVKSGASKLDTVSELSDESVNGMEMRLS